MSNSISDDDLKEVVSAIFHGRKIEAIKLYRKYSGFGLKEAKDAVEELEMKLRAESPEKFTTDEGGKLPAAKSGATGVRVSKGCFGMFAAVLLAGTLMLLFAIIACRY